MAVDLTAERAAARVMAIIRGTDTVAAVAAGRALLAEGVRIIEVALTTPGAPHAIEAIRTDAPDGSLVGAGTVLTASAVADVAAAGAQFVVTPASTNSTWPAACAARSRSAPSPSPPAATGKACRAARN